VLRAEAGTGRYFVFIDIFPWIRREPRVTGLRPKDDIEQSDGDEATGFTGGSIAPLGLSRYWVRQGDCARSYSCAEEST
jgi:hypothetical protein